MLESENSTPDNVEASAASSEGTAPGGKESASRPDSTRRKVKSFLIAIFIVTLFDFIYELSSGWVGGQGAIAATNPIVYFTGALTTVSFFLYRVLDYQTKHPEAGFIRRLSVSFFDLITYFCIIFLGVWGVIFHLLKPIPSGFQLYIMFQRNLGLNLYVGLIICAGIVISRAALQPLITRSNRRITEPVLQQIAIEVPVAAPVAPANTVHFDSTAYEMLNSITREIARMREQINILSSTAELAISERSYAMNPAPENRAPGAGVVKVRTPQVPQQRPASRPGKALETPPPSANLEKVSPSFGSEPSITDSVYQIPDAARDNPWASILSRRNQPQKGAPKIQPSTSVAIAPVTPRVLVPPKNELGAPAPEKDKE